MADEQPIMFPFSEDFQLVLLRLMVLDEVFLLKCARHVREEFFNDRYLAWTFRTIVQYNREFGKTPTLAILDNEAKKQPVDKQAPYFDTLNKVLAAKSVDDEYVRRELTGFVRTNIFCETYKKAATIYNVGNNVGAFQFTRDKMDELHQVDFEKDDTVRWDTIWEDIATAKQLGGLNIPTGITIIDKAMNGGLPPGSLTTLLSGTNAGKSMALINIGYHAVLAGKKIVTIHHEDEELPIKMRVISRFTGIAFNKLMCSEGLLTEKEHQKVELVKERLKKSWMMMFMYGPEVTVEEVYDWLRLKKKEFDFDLVIDDYGQLLRTRQRTDGERFTQAVVYRMFKQTALKLRVAFLTCAQGNREAQKVSRKGVDYLHSTDLAECFEIARVSDNIITLNRSEENSAKDRLVFYLEKQRVGEMGIAVECVSDFSRCVTHTMGKMQQIHSLNPLLQKEKKDGE